MAALWWVWSAQVGPLYSQSRSEGVEIVSVGVALAHAVIPGAFVALSQSQLASLPFMPRARIICAGAYHNFILALMVSVAVYICGDQLYDYVGDRGRVVTDVSMVRRSL